MALNNFPEIRKIRDPLARACSAEAAIQYRHQEVDHLAEIRRDAIEACIESGMAAIDIARKLGVSRSRISQLRSITRKKTT